MTDLELVMEAAKADGITPVNYPFHNGKGLQDHWCAGMKNEDTLEEFKPYLTSRDAIIPVIAKQTDAVIATVCMHVIADKANRRGFKLLLADARLLCTSLVKALKNNQTT